MNIKKLAIWAAAIAVVYHFYKKADDEAKAKAQEEEPFNPQD